MKKLNALLLIPILLLVLAIIMIQTEVQNKSIIIFVVVLAVLASGLFSAWLNGDNWREELEETVEKYDNIVISLDKMIDNRNEVIEKKEASLKSLFNKLTEATKEKGEKMHMVLEKTFEVERLKKALNQSNVLLLRSANMLKKAADQMDEQEAKVTASDNLINEMVKNLDMRGSQIEKQSDLIANLEAELEQYRLGAIDTRTGQEVDLLNN